MINIKIYDKLSNFNKKINNLPDVKLDNINSENLDKIRKNIVNLNNNISKFINNFNDLELKLENNDNININKLKNDIDNINNNINEIQNNYFKDEIKSGGKYNILKDGDFVKILNNTYNNIDDMMKKSNNLVFLI